jgi:hypothetical protein
MGVGGQRHAPAALRIVQEAGWASGSVWTGAGNHTPPAGIRSLDRPARSESLYRLSYPGPQYWWGKTKIRGENTDPVAIFLPQNARWLNWKWKRASAADGRQPTTGIWHCLCKGYDRCAFCLKIDCARHGKQGVVFSKTNRWMTHGEVNKSIIPRIVENCVNRTQKL